MDKFKSIQEVASSLGVFSVNLMAEIFSSPPYEFWAPGQSAKVNVKKYLDALVEQGKLERCDGFYRVKGSRSEYKDHARKLSECIGEFFKIKKIKVIAKREIPLSNGLRADAVILLIKDIKGLCAVLEVCRKEADQYFQAKLNEWERFNAHDELARLFGYEIPHYILTVEGKEVKGIIRFQDLIQILKEEQ